MAELMDDASKLLDVVGLFYDSVLDEGKWHEALQSLACFTGGHAAGYVAANPSEGGITHCETVNIDPVFTEQYVGYYAQREVRLPPAVSYSVGSVMTEDMLVERSVLQRSEIYGDLLLPYEAPHFMFAWLEKTPTSAKTIAIEGTLQHGAFTPEAMRLYALVMPHLVRAVRIREALQSARQARGTLLELLDALPIGVILLDAAGQVVELTSLAERLLRSGSGITQRQGRVHASVRDDDRALQRAVQGALQAGTGESLPKDTVLARRGPNQRPLRVTAIPVPKEGVSFAAARPAAMLLVVDPEQSPNAASDVIQRGLGLTRAEATLASVLFTGVTLREAALQLGFSVNTCKTQLKSIYAKTGCRSHVDLAKATMMTMISQRKP